MSFLLSPCRGAVRAATLSTSTTSACAFRRSFASTRPSRLARLTVVGRLGTDPEITTTSGGTEIIKYIVGSAYGPKENRQTSWFRVASFATKESPMGMKVLALPKGSLVYLEGDATMKSYEDSEGKKQTQLSLVQTKIEVLQRSKPVEDSSPSPSE